jgi:hypothetical protein
MNLITLPTTTLTEATKAELLEYADTLVATHRDEGYDVLGLLAEAAKLELLATRIKEKAKAAASDEIALYGRKGTMKLGVEMLVKEVGVSYDYSSDRVWAELNKTVAEATATRKAQESLLRTIPYEGRIMMDEGTGEEYRVYPPAKSASDGVTLSVK